MNIEISNQDKAILRELAKKQLCLANEEKNMERKKYWYKHNALQGDRPPIHLDAWGLYHELVNPLLACEGEFARQVERQLYVNFVNQEWFDDDRVTPDCFGWNYDCGFKAFDLDEKKSYSTGDKGSDDEGIGIHYTPVLEDLEDDFELLKPSTFWVDKAATEKKIETIQEAFGDILPVYMKMDCLYSVPTQLVIHLMGMENMMISIAVNPELFKKMMDQLADDYLRYFHMLESEKLILPTTEYESVGQATFAFNHELPDSRDGLKLKDVWGFMDSQETLCISPKQFEELVFPCYQKIASEFGLLSYGCCEPVDPFWDNCISKLSNLRKVSISAWANEEVMGERLRGSRIIYHRKPDATMLGCAGALDEEAVRASIQKTLRAAKGCKLEITQRDVYTLQKDPQRGRRYVEIIREEVEKHWQG